MSQERSNNAPELSPLPTKRKRIFQPSIPVSDDVEDDKSQEVLGIKVEPVVENEATQVNGEPLRTQEEALRGSAVTTQWENAGPSTVEQNIPGTFKLIRGVQCS